MSTSDLEHRILEVNQAFADMLGYPRAELVGRTYLEFTHPDDLEASRSARRAAEGAPGGDQRVLIEKRYLHRSGRVVHAMVSIFLVRGEHGRPLHFVGQVVDVTERRRAEAALRENLERFRQAVTQAPDPVAIHAEDGEMIALSEGWLRRSGYRREELPTVQEWGRRAYGADAAVRLDLVRSVYAKPLRQGEAALARELTITAADGGRRTWSFSSAPLGPGPDGRRLAVTLARDVTDHHAAEEALRESERRYRLLAENASDVIWTFDLEAGRFTYVSPSVRRLRGLTVEEALAEPLEHALTPPSLARIREIFARAGEPGGLGPPRGAASLAEVLEQPCADGRVKLVEMTLTPIVDEGGRIRGTQGASRDITARVLSLQAERTAREALHRSLDVLRGVIDGSEAAIFSVDRAYRYTSFNKAHAAIMKAIYGAEIDLGASLLEAQTVGLDRDRAKANLDRAFAGEVVVEDAYSGEPGPGRRYFEVTHHPIRAAAGEVIGAAVFGRDVTARRQGELAQRESVAALARSNADLERFAYAASHDLQEPLRMIASFLQLLERRAGPGLAPDQHEYLTFAVQGAARMQRLVEGLLAFSRVARGDTAPEPVDAGAALAAALANLAVAIRESGAEVVAGALPAVRCSPSLLPQLFQNLVGNALKFHGTSPPAVEIDATREGPAWHFRVRDHGIGIDPRYHERIFSLFQRLHGVDQYEGTGIGLAIAKRIVERQGGQIWVESASGLGATFHFTLPAATAEAPEA